MKSVFFELIFSTLLIGLVIILANPFQLWMPMPVHLAIVAGLLVFFTLLSSVAFRSIGEDEREQAIRLFSYQVSFMTVLAGLTAIVVVQSFNHAVDWWVAGLLILTLIVKLVALSVKHTLH